MKKYFYRLFPLLTIIFISGCRKERVDNPYDEFSRPYTTGLIQFQYETPTMRFGRNTTKDTTIALNSVGNNVDERYQYGYTQPSIPWTRVSRINSNDFINRVTIEFPGVILDSLKLPYTFKSYPNGGGNYNMYAQVNFTVSAWYEYDSSGNSFVRSDDYNAITSFGNLVVTILSRNNNRLQGSFSGDIINQDKRTISTKNGLFDIQIVSK